MACALTLIYITKTLISVKIGAAQIEAAFLTNNFAAVSAQFVRAVGTDRGSILLGISGHAINRHGRRCLNNRRPGIEVRGIPS
jgi:hypothetical protein